jgi:hypothetical protein
MAETATFEDSFALRPFVPQSLAAYFIDISNYDVVSERTQEWLTRQHDFSLAEGLAQQLSFYGYSQQETVQDPNFQMLDKVFNEIVIMCTR